MSKKQTLGQQRAARVRAQLAAANESATLDDASASLSRNQQSNNPENKNIGERYVFCFLSTVMSHHICISTSILIFLGSFRRQSRSFNVKGSTTVIPERSTIASIPTSPGDTLRVDSARLERARKRKEENSGYGSQLYPRLSSLCSHIILYLNAVLLILPGHRPLLLQLVIVSSVRPQYLLLPSQTPFPTDIKRSKVHRCQGHPHL